jgi:2-polyprenyl-3-methyl-5-hydroxy-6-metoxy-1,4-benzoquinol methylase
MPTTAPVAVKRTLSPICWEEPACPLCGGQERSTILEAQDPHPDNTGLWFAIVQCAGCGMKFTSPRPDEQSIGQFYPADYRPHRAKKSRTKSRGSKLAWLRGRPCVERRTLPWHGDGRLLDFGCGGGSFLERMAAQGWRVTGLDSSAETVASVQRRGYRCLCGTLPHLDLAPGTFDVVSMWHSLEHVHNPLKVLAAARELLAPQGKLLVAVPNIDSWPFEWFRASWFGLELPRHLSHFTPKTLTAMISKAGFKNVKLRHIRHSDWLRSSAKLAASRPHATAWQKFLTGKYSARFVAWVSYVVKKSDCILATANV